MASGDPQQGASASHPDTLAFADGKQTLHVAGVLGRWDLFCCLDRGWRKTTRCVGGNWPDGDRCIGTEVGLGGGFRASRVAGGVQVR